MPTKARIRLWSTNVENLNYVITQIRGIVEKTGIEMRGPIPLPTSKLEVPIMRLPHGEGRKKWEKWEMRVHKRLIDIAADERVMRQLMRVRVPEDVYIEIQLI
ncbi:ribosomal protein S10 [Sulfolobus islandicus Y.G.57.14]|jgi:ribosomal protein S10(archaeal)/S20(eukaryotic)|uniref:Small ribosomal subunit protein uS10 n=16 Tax=Sulfolobaceae TaxID=118883 RepID=RS10_SACS2|nr:MULTISPECIES: 30S ribosomal protein S10 [Sulfolobaceae]C3MRL0.1 RecName: Full=Small ribosomal subunit protein uS10; AltName: Full=30S ribosomal protein S10 [Sulfolobus islandicus L.S.2.15]C3MYA6.1 RecName: Full=Small ribosomal subunit protein uS10; AltName: Full=30S ribosomal protein S10 [Sulfolobus islandicus M.14.25]C3MZN5.1 RecName: Full=Small ribosomal subunit protein uS10; AltName: Full=30S ribosomal protein S10 [Sulfolobus islandicus M.16.27]C3N7Q8.1 RecName: Full=Small ribosomal subun